MSLTREPWAFSSERSTGGIRLLHNTCYRETIGLLRISNTRWRRGGNIPFRGRQAPSRGALLDCPHVLSAVQLFQYKRLCIQYEQLRLAVYTPKTKGTDTPWKKAIPLPIKQGNRNLHALPMKRKSFSMCDYSGTTEFTRQIHP